MSLKELQESLFDPMAAMSPLMVSGKRGKFLSWVSQVTSSCELSVVWANRAKFVPVQGHAVGPVVSVNVPSLRKSHRAKCAVSRAGSSALPVMAAVQI